jgi:hypothetical protein
MLWQVPVVEIGGYVFVAFGRAVYHQPSISHPLAQPIHIERNHDTLLMQVICDAKNWSAAAYVCTNKMVCMSRT